MSFMVYTYSRRAESKSKRSAIRASVRLEDSLVGQLERCRDDYFSLLFFLEVTVRKCLALATGVLFYLLRQMTHRRADRLCGGLYLVRNMSLKRLLGTFLKYVGIYSELCHELAFCG